MRNHVFKRAIFGCFSVVLLGFMLAVIPANAAIISTGSLSYPPGNGIAATEPWANEATTMSWRIADMDNGWYRYDYRYTSFQPFLSGVVIEVSDDPALEFDFLSGYRTEGPQLFDLNDILGLPGDPLPDIFGVVFIPEEINDQDVTEFEFSFYANRGPVPGNFVAAVVPENDNNTGNPDAIPRLVATNLIAVDGPRPILAVNTGYIQPDEGQFIMRPDTRPVPEPGSFLLLGSGLIGIAIIRKRMSSRLRLHSIR